MVCAPAPVLMVIASVVGPLPYWAAVTVTLAPVAGAAVKLTVPLEALEPPVVQVSVWLAALAHVEVLAAVAVAAVAGAAARVIAPDGPPAMA